MDGRHAATAGHHASAGALQAPSPGGTSIGSPARPVAAPLSELAFGRGIRDPLCSSTRAHPNEWPDSCVIVMPSTNPFMPTHVGVACP